MQAHCPVVGVCLPIEMARKLLSKALGQEIDGSDYEFHANVVFRSRERNAVSEAIQKALEQRFTVTLQRFAKAKTADAVADLWCLAVNEGDVAGALWSALTHPRCDAALQECILEDVHMIQHQAGALVRDDIRAAEKLKLAHSALQTSHTKLEARIARMQSEHVDYMETMVDALNRARSASIRNEAQVCALQSQHADQTSRGTEINSRKGFVQKIAQLMDRVRTLEAEVTRLSFVPPVTPVDATVMDKNIPAQTQDVAPQLTDCAIACIGGRAGAVAEYRRLVEQCGARFSFHDGGVEDNRQRLEAVLASADLIICQAGCISHNAYWSVKEHCKRLGKHCVYLENPSVSSFTKGLRSIPVVAPVRNQQ